VGLVFVGGDNGFQTANFRTFKPSWLISSWLRVYGSTRRCPGSIWRN
jgi:hypothetical protein